MFLLLLSGVLLAWLFSRWLYRTFWHRNLSVQIEFLDRFLYEGETSVLKEVVINDKFLPLPALEVRFSSNRSLEFLNDASVNTSSTDLSYKRDVFSFLFHQKIRRSLPFTAHKRGIYQIYDVSLTAYDFFFHPGYYADVPQKTVLYVYPKQVDTYRIVLLCQAISGMVLSRRRLYPDPFEFSGIRTYRRQDPMNHINWKASARSGELMVNQFDSTTSILLTLIFDLEDPLILKYEDLVEETIRITSSLAARLVKMNMPFYVKSNVTDASASSAFSMYIAAGAGNMRELNQKLACIDSRVCSLPTRELLLAERSLKRSDHIYLFISKNRDAELTQLLLSLIVTGNQILWVLPVRAQDHSPELIHDPRITVIPWEL